MTALRFYSWVGGPGGHQVDLGIATFDDTGAPIDIPSAVRRLDSPHGWALDAVLRRFRPGRTATAYGDAWCEPMTGTPRTDRQLMGLADRTSPWPDADVVVFPVATATGLRRPPSGPSD